jgi:hypothetical protein
VQVIIFRMFSDEDQLLYLRQSAPSIGATKPREIPAGVVDGHYFGVIGLRPVLGRLLTPADDGPNAAGAVVLTYHFWKTSLHSDPSVIGKAVRLESATGARNLTVVGVLEPCVPYPVATEILANIVTSPHHLSATMVTGRELMIEELQNLATKHRRLGRNLSPQKMISILAPRRAVV